MGFSRLSRAMKLGPALIGLTRADVVHLHSSVALRAGSVVGFLKRRDSLLIVSVHGGGFRTRFDSLQPKRRQAVQQALSKANWVCVSSESHRQDVVASIPWLSERVAVIEPVLLTERLVNQYRAITRRSGVIGTTGLWDRTYDFDGVIQVFESLRGRAPHLAAGLEIMVSSAGADATYRKCILDRVFTSDCAEFITVKEDYPDVLSRMATWSILVRAAVRDSFGMVVREAIALGTPVVATDCCERPESVRLVRPGDHSEMVKAVSDTLETPPDLSGDQRHILARSTDALAQILNLYHSRNESVTVEVRRGAEGPQ